MVEKYHAKEPLFPIKVKCHAGYRGEELPRRLIFGEREVVVEEIQDRWLAPDHRYFKVIGDDESLYIIRHDANSNQWELTLYRTYGQNLKRT